MLRNVLIGAAAGAVGTAALNITTYADMVVRGRGASDVPAKTAGKLLDRAGVHLADGAAQKGDETAQHRLSGAGALLGYAAGLGVGAGYGLLRPLLRGLPTPLAGLVLGAAAMAASDIPATATGATDPADWGVAGWVADIVPHLIYGLVTAAAFEAFAGQGAGSRPA